VELVEDRSGVAGVNITSATVVAILVAVTKLHIQATTVSNICQLVNIVLDSTASNYASGAC
jgi:hypothetical protein